jgi:hypothetical protein
MRRGIKFCQFLIVLFLPFVSFADSSLELSQQLQKIGYKIDSIEFKNRTGDTKEKSAELLYWQNRLHSIRASYFRKQNIPIKLDQKFQQLDLRIHRLVQQLELPPKFSDRLRAQIKKKPTVPEMPGNDDCLSAYFVGYGTYAGHTTFATGDGWATCDQSTSPDVWFRYIASENATVVFSLVDSDYDTVLSIHNPITNGCPGDPSDQIVCTDRGYPGYGKITLPVNAGTEYLIRVSGEGSYNTGSYVLTIQKAGFIAGRITNAFTQAPAAGVIVSFYNPDYGFYGSTFTNANGEYVSSDLPAGTYYVVTENHGEFVDELYDDIPCYQGDCDPSSGTPVVVNESTTTGIDFALNPTGSMSGRITTSYDSSPIENVQVRLYDQSGSYMEDTYTDDSGNYFFTGLDQGAYFVVTNNSDNFIDELYDNISCPYSCNPTDGTPVAVTYGTTTTDINFILDLGGYITGTISDLQSSFPIEDVEVIAYNSSGELVGYGSSAGNGFYFIEGLPTGTYYVRTESEDYLDELYDNLPCDDDGCDPLTGTPIAVTINTVTPNIDFELAVSGSISGNIQDGNNFPIEDVFIAVTDSNGNFVRGSDSDDSGHYKVSGLSTGDFYVQTFSNYADEVYNNIPCEGDCDPTTGDAVHVVTSNETIGIDFQLLDAGKISGTVKDELSQLPISNVHIYVYDDQGNFVRSDSTDFSGQYLIVGLQNDGDYFVVTDSDDRYRNEIYDNFVCLPSNCDPTSGTPVPVSAGTTTTNIDFELTPSGKVTGTIRDAISGNPVVGIEVQVFDSAGHSFSGRYTDPQGFYSINVIFTGDYYVVAYPYEKYIVELYDGVHCPSFACDFAQGTPVHIALGATTSGIDFNLDVGGSISGKLLDELTGDPIHSDILIYDSTGSFVGSTFTNNDGSYSTDSILQTGNYFVRTSASYNGYMDEIYDNHPCDQCDVTSGDPVAVTEGSVTTDINFDLIRPTISVNDVSIVEGNSGTKELVFTVTSSIVPPHPVLLYYQDDDGSAYGGFDFQPVSGELSIYPPNNTATISVPIYGDVDPELDETFSIKITTAFYATIVDSEGIGTIVNDDGAACQFADDFEDGSVDPLKWTVVKDAFTEQLGYFVGSPVKRKAQAIATGFSGCGSNCSIDTTMRSGSEIGSKVVTLAWYADKSNKVEFIMDQDAGKWILKQRVNGKVAAKQKAISIIDANVDYAVAISFDGNQFQVQIDGVTVITMNKTMGSIPFGTSGYEVKNTTGFFSSICVK